MSKHTPGPWEVSDGSKYRVMSANWQDGSGIRYGIYICDTANNPKTRTPETEANARLIAAAPELYHALLHALHRSHEFTDSCSGCELAVKAINKVEGR